MPGPGWQMWAVGKRGKEGPPGPRGEKGSDGGVIISADVDAEAMQLRLATPQGPLSVDLSPIAERILSEAR